MRKLTSQKGFGLVEILISTAIFSFVFAGLYTMLHVGSVSWQTQNASFNAQGQIRLIMDILSRDLRVEEGLSITQSASAVTFVFTKSDEGTVTYTWTNVAGATANQLLRTTTAGTRIIARDISALSLTDNVSNVLVNVTVNVKPLKNSAGTANNSNIRLVKEIAKR